jgi:hypothetical protein
MKLISDSANNIQQRVMISRKAYLDANWPEHPALTMQQNPYETKFTPIPLIIS